MQLDLPATAIPNFGARQIEPIRCDMDGAVQQTNEPARHALAIEGMTCGACARSVERALMRVPGVECVSVELGAHVAVVQGSASADAMVAAVEAAGYHGRPLPEFPKEARGGRSACC